MGMTIDDAIKKYKNNAEYERTHGNLQGCLEFQQLAGWLKDYKRLLEQEPTTKNNLGVDCISREQAQTEIEINASRYTVAKERGGTGQVEWSDQLIKVSDAVDIIRHLPPVTPQEPRWIPVSERLPEENKTVIASTKYGVYPEARYSKEDGWEWAYESGADYWEELEEVKAWMPLPQPYKAESEAEDGKRDNM